MDEFPKYPSMPFNNETIIENGVHVGFTVGIKLAYSDFIVVEKFNAICGEEQASLLVSGPIEDYTKWSYQVIQDNHLISKANTEMDTLV